MQRSCCADCETTSKTTNYCFDTLACVQMKEKGNEKHFDVLVGVRLSPDSFFSVASSLLAKLRSEQRSRQVASYSVEICDTTRSLHQFGFNLPASLVFDSDLRCLFLESPKQKMISFSKQRRITRAVMWQVWRFDTSNALGKHVHLLREKIHTEIISKFTFPPSVITRHAWSHLEATSSPFPPKNKKRLRPIIV